jgi:ribosomal protein S18 acetylase RimI-like enzyme
MQTTIAIRTAAIEELPVIASFWMAMYEEAGIFRESDFIADWRTRFEEYFSRRRAAGEAQYFIAADNDRIVGTAGAMLDDGYPTIVHGLRFGYIFGVRVEPEYRGRGIATALTRETIAFLKRRQCRRIRLHASPLGRPIYEGLGFTPTNEMQLRE